MLSRRLLEVSLSLFSLLYLSLSLSLFLSRLCLSLIEREDALKSLKSLLSLYLSLSLSLSPL